MAHVEIEASIDGLGNIIYCGGVDFRPASRAVLKKSDELISLRDLAYARIQDVKTYGTYENSSLCTKGSHVREGSLFVQNPKTKRNKKIWLRDSLVLKNTPVRTHLGCAAYLSPNFDVNAYLEQIGKAGYFVLSDNADTKYSVPGNRFGEDEQMVFAFQDQAKEYGKLLVDSQNFRVHWIFQDGPFNIQARPYANQLWLIRLYDIPRSEGELDFSQGVRGLQRIGGAAATEISAIPNIETYNSEEVQSFVGKTLQSVGITGNLHRTILSDLEARLKYNEEWLK